MTELDVAYVRDLCADMFQLLDNLLSEHPAGELQRQLVADMDDKTFHELARLRNRCQKVMRALEDRT
jgi:hypothetical protein